MDLDIQFGDLEESQPAQELRPDQNRHFAVVACQQPQSGELPIYVYLDVMLDIEEHAASNTNVELGGVLLGGQYEDDQGRPFVVVSDCLRAEHYEATKGSFKFTHETWEQISRQREEFPDGFEMVGWYHTHPDWGVFLSGMDMFICDNFFNRPLDVALVVDPCRGDRGWFEWTGRSEERIRRTGGFFLVSSRYRQAELEWVSEFYGGESAMSRDPRYRPVAGQIGPQAAPVVNIAEPSNPTQNVILWSMLAAQFLLVALIGWRMTTDNGPGELALQAQQERHEELIERIGEYESQRVSDARSDAQREILDLLVANIADGSPGLLDELEKSRVEHARTVAALDSQIALTASLQRREQGLNQELLARNDDLRQMTARARDDDKTIKELSADVADRDATIEEYEAGGPKPWYKDWRAIASGVLAMVVAAVAGMIMGYTLRRDDETDELSDPDRAFRPPPREPEAGDDEPGIEIREAVDGEPERESRE